MKSLYTHICILFIAFIFPYVASAQDNGTIIGTVIDRESQQAIQGAIIAVEGTSYGEQTDSIGKFRISNIPPKTYNLIVQYVGYKPQKLFNIVVSNGNAAVFNIELEKSTELGEVVVRTNTFGKRYETPLSVQSLTSEEIKSNPGGNYDISRAIQALPGVGGTSGGAARNDLIIRGGAPSENVYYLDGVEVPQINHFSTQGASGGAQGILNVSFIENVTLSSSSFAARYDNALSSVLQFKQRDGNPDKFQGNIRVSSSEIALTTEGPISKKTTFLASARRSYLQYFFQLIDLPIRPNYWDFQYKVTHKIDEKTTISAIGLGAIDEFSFAVPKSSTLEKQYIIRSLPTINQWNYTVGFSLKRLIKSGYYNIVASRNMFNNRLDRFEEADFGNEARRTFRSRSQEIENKLRLEVNQSSGEWKFNYGASLQYVKFHNDLFSLIRKQVLDNAGNVLQPGLNINYYTAIDFFRYGVFGSVNRRFIDDKLSLTFGIRTDLNNYLNDGNNPINALSPRFTASYSLTDKFNINGTVGRYAKLPVYTVLGFRDATGALANKDNKYIISDHYAGGVEYLPNSSLRITLEGFYKQYSNYPVSLLNNISLANLGADFGAIGNERVTSTGKGRSYGVELFVQQKLVKKFFITASYTLFWSEFTGNNNVYIPSSWDTRHLASLILGRKFARGWELGAKYRLSGGTPYTPFDMIASRLNYATTGQGTLDYTRINQERLPLFNQLDIRIDKKINFKKASLDFFLDFQNVAFSRNVSKDYYSFQRNTDNSFAATDNGPLKADGSNAIPVLIPNIDQTITPALGIIFEF
jgi:outer membrane receptor for ferrienterochelin and colicin